MAKNAGNRSKKKTSSRAKVKIAALRRTRKRRIKGRRKS